jgi:rsbT antagonist protein RsbS
MLQFRKELLEFTYKTGAIAVILDLSGINIMDLNDFNALKETMLMVKIMGGIPVISGMNPGVVASIIDLGADIDDIYAALNLDEALKLVHKMSNLNSNSGHGG